MTLSRRVAVISPHLDDAVLSLGAALHEAASRGADVRVVTVLADDPDSDRAAGPWDQRAGFASEGEAARARRDEDRAACAILGVTPVWLPFGDMQYGRGSGEDAVWEAVVTAVGSADDVLVPGFPLSHPDHRWITRLALARGLTGARRIGLYIEQPYVLGRVIPALRPGAPAGLDGHTGSPRWGALRVSRADRAAKRAACRAYASQLPLLGHRPLLLRLAAYERARRGETIAWLGARPLAPVTVQVRTDEAGS